MFKPGAEPRGLGARMVDAETAPFIPVSRIADPPVDTGDNPSAVAGVLSATVLPARDARRRKPIVTRASKLKQREG